MQARAAIFLRMSAISALLALGACGDDTVSYECQDGWLCFPADAVPSDLIGGGDGTSADTATTPDEGGPDTAVDTPGGADTTPADSFGTDSGAADGAQEDVVIVPGTFGAPCNGNIECNSGWCVEGQAGYICTKTCVEDCPDGFDCKSVTSGGGDLVVLCAPRIKKLCTPCGDDSQCTGGACLDIDGAQQCSYTCNVDTDCPTGFGCAANPDDTHTGSYCVPNSNSCTCTPVFNGGQRSCQSSSGLGTCYGIQTCDQATGWGDCSAPAPTDELCDGLDNDCDGLIDEDLPSSQPCVNTVDGVGSCAGTEVCFGPAGWVCQASTPEAETCDFKDNDCDGDTDEDFKLDDQYASLDHCGTCNSSCAVGFPNAAATSCGLFGGSPQCKVDTCEQGYSKINDFQCVPNVASICQPCATNDNCLGDGAACVALGEGSFCGQSCGSATDCPSGYDCSDVGAAANQCVPSSGSCSCDGTNTLLSRACSVTYTPPDPAQPAYTCNGFEQCTADGWGSCGLPSEECDNVDNDCDGAIDEDFKTAQGQYLLVEHCGGCNISCLALSPANANPICDTATGVAQCGFECKADYFNVNGSADDGCECTPTAGDDLAGDGVDSNCDGIDGEVDNGVFVAKNGDDSAVGTIDAPLLTIDEAIDRAGQYGVRDVYVATGVYSESVSLVDGIGVFGGYASDFLDRDILLFETAIVGQDPTSVQPGAVTAVTVGASGASAKTILDGFTIFGANAANTAGANSYGVYVRNGGPELELRNNRIFGGAGGAGAVGFKGTDGADGKGGTPGVDAYDVNKFTGSQSRSCAGADTISGGAGGGLTCGSVNVSGGLGGDASCPTYNTAPPSASDGATGQGAAGGNGGDGGYGAQIDTGNDCGFCAVPDAGPMAGGLGDGGVPGTFGTAGTGCNQGAGQVVDGHWQGTSGAPGGDGAHGSGGGGGGAGGGVSVLDQQCTGTTALDPDIDGIDVGGTGGGGGSGGCSGTSGTGGVAGGGSFGLFIVFDASAPEVPVVTGNTVRRGSGGAGGGAGGGGAGGVGGSGAGGGASGEGDFTTFCARGGASGGDGGQGGHGGGGGGGCGGASYGIFVDTAGGTSGFAGAYNSGNGFIAGGQGGVGGSGGSSPGDSGTPGGEGSSADTNF